ncbi:28S ribosomal protein S17, mitochondrial-like [Mya arenaria]|uniref:28S ribosomal protein S17, mitochondrial-like n=1 Tax=Mya arenaria TaxID=6604 RepID=UPI0022E37F02|nr:28S ribosomal protein S17, mitochondrial-like [Mya arenaria]
MAKMVGNRVTEMVRIGQVIKKNARGDLNLVKVRAQNMKIDRRLMMYFPSKKDRWCLDENNSTKVGDIVVMRHLERPVAREVFTKIGEIMFQVGNVRDPLTGRLCRGTEYVDETSRFQEQTRRGSSESVDNKKKSENKET